MLEPCNGKVTEIQGEEPMVGEAIFGWGLRSDARRPSAPASSKNPSVLVPLDRLLERADEPRGDRPRNLLAGTLGAACMLWASGALALVPNGDFSAIAAGMLMGWNVGTQPPRRIPIVGEVDTPSGVAVGLDEGEKGTGSHSLRLSSRGSTGEDYGLAYSSDFPLVPGFDYEMSVRYRARGLAHETLDRSLYCQFLLDLFMEGPSGFVGSVRIHTWTNSETPVTLRQLSNFTTRFKVPPNVQWGSARLQLINKFRGAEATVRVQNVSVEPLDPELANGGMEVADAEGRPRGWQPFGAAKTSWTTEIVHSGTHSIAVSDSPDRTLSGWSTIVPVRPDRTYAFGGYIKGGDLHPEGTVEGGAIEIQFLDEHGQPLGSPLMSPGVGPGTDWTLVTTPKSQAPVGAVTARLTAGLSRARGTAWFDDLILTIDPVAPAHAPRVALQGTGPSKGVRYAKNLLANGDVESGEGDKPAGWTYVGRSSPDWSNTDLTRLYTRGRPDFSVGRGKGEWTHETVFSGKGALLNVSIDPPRSTNAQWYGRNPVDGFWLSDPVPCQPGKRYLASAWLRPGRRVQDAWLGPLEVRFYDASGTLLEPTSPTRPGVSAIAAGTWSYYTTLPYVAPRAAATLRLRFGQELAADQGGWGRTYGDNFAVWELPAEVPAPDKSVFMNDFAHRQWFEQATAVVKPPFLPASTDAPVYESVWGRLVNPVPGNLYYDPASGVTAAFSLFNLLGERRTVSLRIVRYDAWGNVVGPTIRQPNIRLEGASTTNVKVDLPPSGKYGAYYLDAEISDGDAVVGRTVGRYAVMPPPFSRTGDPASIARHESDAPSGGKNPFAVTILLTPVSELAPPYQQELGTLLKAAGFGVAWVRLYYEPSLQVVRRKLASLEREIAFYHDIGLRTVVQLMPGVTKPVKPEVYTALGRMIGSELRGRAVAIGNWGIEQANSASPFRGGGKDHLTDDDYDTVLAAQYDGIKSVAPDLPVLVGNIATDLEGITIRRLYGPRAGGKFDGSIMNAYLGPLTVARKTFAEYDAHGDTGKTIWAEEQAEPQSPFEGEARRYGEIEGAIQMVRSWLTMFGTLAPRLESMTVWGFLNHAEDELMMVTPSLQPRPHFVAHAVMADALKGAGLAEDLSRPGVSLFRWSRADGEILVAWADAGERDIVLSVPSGRLTVTDIMGNRHVQEAADGALTLKLGVSPIYLTGGGKVAVKGAS